MSGLNLAPGDPALFDRLIADWVLDSMPVGDPRWQALVVKKTREARRKLAARRILSGLGLARPAKSFRQPDYVKGEYNRIWAGEHWPQPVKLKAPERPTEITWRERGYRAAHGAVSQPHLDRLMHLIGLLKPSRVLEVGCGAGQNLFAVAGMFPGIAFEGLELSDSGLAAARAVQSLPELPAVVKAYGPRAHLDPRAYRRIGFTQGTAAAMPFEDGRFDLVFSRLAIEQMNAIQDMVFREIARVCDGHAAMIEPFADFAETPLQRLSTEKKNHFGAPVAAIAAFGLSPVAVFSDWPQKLTQGNGLVVARRSS